MKLVDFVSPYKEGLLIYPSWIPGIPGDLSQHSQVSNADMGAGVYEFQPASSHHELNDFSRISPNVGD